MHRGILYLAHYDKMARQFIVEAFNCHDGSLHRSVTHPASLASPKVNMLRVEARHVYVVVSDNAGEQPFQLISFTLDLEFEASIPLDAFWDSTLFFCKHTVAYHDPKSKSVKEVGFDIDHGCVSRFASYAVKLKRNEEVRSLLIDAIKLVVITSLNNAHIYSRSHSKLMGTVKLPMETLSIKPFPSHLVFITPVNVAKATKGFLSPRGAQQEQAMKLSQGEVFKI
jgi:hypothetical protein